MVIERCNDLSFAPTMHCEVCNTPCHTYCFNFVEKRCKQCVIEKPSPPIKESGNGADLSTSLQPQCEFKRNLIRKTLEKTKGKKNQDKK